MLATVGPVAIVIPTVLILIGIRKYREYKWGKCKNNVTLDGKVAIVTGANSGIGLEITRELASRNAQVILACRNIEKAQKAVESIKKKLKDAVLVPMQLDLASLNSIKDFADQIKKEYPEIHLLFNNAGVSFPRSKPITTFDGYEIHFGVNHLGHFYLTNLLVEVLKKSRSRVIVVASSLHERGEVDFANLEKGDPRSSKKGNLYSNSKLMNVYFARELAKRNKTINVYVVCPGWVYTGLFRNSVKWWHYILISPIAFFFMRSAKQGCQTPIYCATQPELEEESGNLYRDCKRYNSRKIFYEATQQRLWKESEKLISAKTE